MISGDPTIMYLHAQHFPSAQISPPNMQSESPLHVLSQLDPSGHVPLLVLILFLLNSKALVVVEVVDESLVDDGGEAVEALAENLVGSEEAIATATGGAEASAAEESGIESKKLHRGAIGLSGKYRQ
uniref:Uncharacterized protein n=1 Tax=Plectus sambesii TaxID=2011161 RepID=A0A914VV72_9BILA